MRRLGLIVALVFAATAALALDPTEMLDDPALEARARTLDNEIRCVVCQSEALASSNAEWARDARRTIRSLITEGRTNDDVKAFFVERYGEFVLMDPAKTGSNLVLWAAGPLMLLLAGGIAFGYLRGRSVAAAPAEDALNAQEQARLKEILKE